MVRCRRRNTRRRSLSITIISSHRIASHPIGGSEDRMHMHAWNGMASNQTLVGWATVRAIRSRDVTRR